MAETCFNNAAYTLVKELLKGAHNWQYLTEIRISVGIANASSKASIGINYNEIRKRPSQVLAILSDSRKTPNQMKAEIISLATNKGMGQHLLAILSNRRIFVRITPKSRESVIDAIKDRFRLD